MAEEFAERTEAPTAKRRRDAAEKGDVLRSREFATALVVMGGWAWLALFGPSLVSACKALMTAGFQFGRGDIEDYAPFRPLMEAGWKLAPSLLSLFAVSLTVAIGSQVALGSPSFNAALWAPKVSRLNPGSGLKRIFGPAGWVELGKSLLKIVLLGSIGVYMLWSSSHTALGLMATDVDGAVATLGGTLMRILFAMALGLLLIAGIDVPVQIMRLLKKLRMSKQEIKDEHKETEGSPEAKGALRQRQHAMAKRNMRKAVAEAHVILTNPPHFAVALRYDRASDHVPVVVARGRGVLAQAIRELGGEARVPVLEYPAIARALYYTSREGQEIRDDLYAAIATILAFVFRLNVEAGGTAPDVLVPPGARFDENGVQGA